jgi:2-keto-3-deoxy-L-rhamnonate aldolase RhmA
VNLVFEMDSIHEGFTIPRYLRSTFVGLFWAPVAARFVGIDATTASGIVILFGLTYALERATTEFWKTFIRDEDQSKYFIPMQFHVFGHVLRNRLARLAVGLGFVGVAVVLLRVVQSLQPPPGAELPLWQVLLVASIGGWYSACGGAFKDAPIEGFEWLKFFRSPVSAGFYGFLVSHFTDSLVLIALCAIGYTVATLETYKTFFFPSVPRGKFAGKPILFPAMLEKRQKFVPLYVAIWIGIVASFTVAFVQESGGGATLEAAEVAPPAGNALVELWRDGSPAFGVYVPNERERGATGPDGERLGALYTVEGGRRLARNPLYDYVFLNLEGRYDAEAISAIAEGLASVGAESPPTLLVRIPPISADGVGAARARVIEALDLGADGIVVPHVRDVEEAHTAVGFFADVSASVWSPANPDGSIVVMLMVEDPDAVEAAGEIAQIPGYSALACGIGSLTRAMEGDREGAEAGNLEVLAHATRAGLADMITANSQDVGSRVEQGFLGLLMSGPGADAAIEVGRAAAGHS